MSENKQITVNKNPAIAFRIDFNYSASTMRLYPTKGDDSDSVPWTPGLESRADTIARSLLGNSVLVNHDGHSLWREYKTPTSDGWKKVVTDSYYR